MWRAEGSGAYMASAHTSVWYKGGMDLYTQHLGAVACKVHWDEMWVEKPQTSWLVSYFPAKRPA